MSISEKLTTIAENERKVYDAGYAKGEKDVYDAFWDAYQEKGNRSMYTYTFAGYGWDDENFYPKYDLNLRYNNSYMFIRSRITDLASRLRECNVTLNTRMASGVDYMFAYSQITHFPEIDVRGTSQIYNIFYDCRAKTIDKFIIAENNKWYGTNSFGGCGDLEHVIFEGTVAYGISFASCKLLDLESLKSIITSLKDYSGTDNEHSQTLTLHSDGIALLDSDGETAEYTDSNGNVTKMTWAELVDAKKWNLVSA